MTNWSKVMEVFASGIIGVFVVMVALQVTTQLSTWLIDRFESWNKAREEQNNEEPRPRAVAVKE